MFFFFFFFHTSVLINLSFYSISVMPNTFCCKWVRRKGCINSFLLRSLHFLMMQGQLCFLKYYNFRISVVMQLSCWPFYSKQRWRTLACKSSTLQCLLLSYVCVCVTEFDRRLNYTRPKWKISYLYLLWNSVNLLQIYRPSAMHEHGSLSIEQWLTEACAFHDPHSCMNCSNIQ